MLSFGGFLGMGDKLFAVPWDALTLDEDRKCFVLDADKGKLENAPGFDKDNWPDMTDTLWESKYIPSTVKPHTGPSASVLAAKT